MMNDDDGVNWLRHKDETEIISSVRNEIIIGSRYDAVMR